MLLHGHVQQSEGAAVSSICFCGDKICLCSIISSITETSANEKEKKTQLTKSCSVEIIQNNQPKVGDFNCVQQGGKNNISEQSLKLISTK